MRLVKPSIFQKHAMAAAVVLATSPLYNTAAVANESFMLEEIVVHARKKAESLQDAPIVVSAFSGDAIERFNMRSMEDISDFTPSLIVNEAVGTSGALIAMRGVSTPPGSSSADQSVSMVIDNMAISHSTISRIAQLDVEQVEVLKGPQALFFGKNSTGGILSYRTTDPTDETEIILNAGREFKGDETFGQLIVSGALTDTLKSRLVMRYTDLDGWLDNTAIPDDGSNPVVSFLGLAPGASAPTSPQVTSEFARATFLWDPIDNLSMRTKISYDEREDQGFTALKQTASCESGTIGSRAGGLHQPTEACKADNNAPLHDLNQAAADAIPRANGNGRNRGESRIVLFSNEIDYTINDNWDLTSVTGFFSGEDFTLANYAPGNTAGLHGGSSYLDQTHITQEFRLASAFEGDINYTVGAFFGKSTIESEIVVYFPGVGLFTPTAPVREVDTDAISAFGQIDWSITDTLTFSAGARWSEEEKELTIEVNGVEAQNYPNSDRTFDNVSPEATLTWQPEEHLTFFISYKEGFKSGGYNTTFIPALTNLIDAPEDISYDQETVDGFEIGAKTEWLDNRLRVNGAIYHFQYDNLQTVVFDPAASALSIVNAGTLVTQGVEMEAIYLPNSIEGLTLTGNFAWNDAAYKGEFLFDCYSGQTSAEGCIDGKQDLDGEAPVVAPELQANFGVVYEMALADSLSLEFTAQASYSDEYLWEQEHSPLSLQDSYWKYNAGVTLRPDDDKWSLSLTGRNLTDEQVCASGGTVTASDTIPNDQFCTAQRGRQIWAEMKYQF